MLIEWLSSLIEDISGASQEKIKTRRKIEENLEEKQPPKNRMQAKEQKAKELEILKTPTERLLEEELEENKAKGRTNLES